MTTEHRHPPGTHQTLHTQNITYVVGTHRFNRRRANEKVVLEAPARALSLDCGGTEIPARILPLPRYLRTVTVREYRPGCCP